MAVTQSQYNFIRFSANGDQALFKGRMAGLILSKTSRTSVGAVRISNYGKNYHLVPLTFFLSAADPLVPVMFGGDGLPVEGLHVGVCSNMNVIAVRR